MTATRAAVVARVRFARTLGVAPADLGMVDAVEPAELDALRHQVAESLFAAGRPRFERVANLAQAVPPPVAAKVAEAAVPPLLAARMAELIAVDKAVGLVGRFSDAYLAEVACGLDIARVPELVAAIPAAKIASTADVLADRGEWVVIAGFVSFVAEDAVAPSVAPLTGEQLLRIGYYIDDVDRLNLIGTLMTEQQLDGIVAAAAGHGLWDEAAWLAGTLDAANLERVAARYAPAGPDVHEAFDRAAADGRLPADQFARLTGR